MNRTELVEAVAGKTELTQAQANAAVTAALDAIVETVAGGDKVTIPGFGTFELRHRDARTGRNPQTGETIQIAASSSPAFKAGSAFKKAANN